MKLYSLVLGCSMWFADFLFVARNWAKDEQTRKCLRGQRKTSAFASPRVTGNSGGSADGF
ncbi:unnamed protein product [Lathyrus oleraceus]